MCLPSSIRYWAGCLCLAALALSSSVLQAADPVFEEEITVTATGSEEEVADVPAAVTVITREEIDDSQTESVAELLRRVPGVTVVQSGAEGSVASVFTRGTESDHTLVLFDGIRLNSPYFAGYDWSQATTAGLERVEVARGPYSALWGADAVGGVVNMIPRRGADGFDGELFAEGGEDSWRRYQAVLSYGSGAFDLFASGLHREGEDELPNSDFETSDLLLDAGWSWGRGSRVAILIQDLDAELGIPFSGATLTPNRRQQAEQRLVAVPLRWQISVHWQLDANVARVERDFAFADPDDFWTNESQTSADTTQARLSSHHRLGDHTLSWGAEWREDEVHDVSGGIVNLDDHGTDVLGLFVQDLWRLAKALRLIVGARWDDTDEWGSEISPRLQLGWRTSDTVELRLGYGEAFRQPSVGELYFPFSGNPDLNAETSRSYELGFVVTPLDRRSRYELNLFRTDLDNLIDFDYATYAFDNTSEAEIQGAELAMHVLYTDELSSRLQITYLDTEDAVGDPLLRRPEWSASYTLSGNLWQDIRGSLVLRWVDDRDDVDPVTFERSVVNQSFYTINLALAWQIWTTAELTLRVVNATDEDYQEVLGYPAPGRRFIGGLRIDL